MESSRAGNISEYQIGSEIGRGTSGAVFAATHETGRHFAIKRFFSGHDADREIENITRIWSERFNSPFLVRFFHTLKDPGDVRFGKGLSLVFELCQEGSVTQFITVRVANRQPFLTAAELLTAALQLTSGLTALHALRLVHRDIAPRTVLIARNETEHLVFKIGDVCQRVDYERDEITAFKMSLHTAPDQEQKADFRSDVFSLGLVLYELATLKIIDVTSGKGDIGAAFADMKLERDAVRMSLAADGLRKRYGDELHVISIMLSERAIERPAAADALRLLSQIDASGVCVPKCFSLALRRHGSVTFCCRPAIPVVLISAAGGHHTDVIAKKRLCVRLLVRCKCKLQLLQHQLSCLFPVVGLICRRSRKVFDSSNFASNSKFSDKLKSVLPHVQ